MGLGLSAPSCSPHQGQQGRYQICPLTLILLQTTITCKLLRLKLFPVFTFTCLSQLPPQWRKFSGQTRARKRQPRKPSERIKDGFETPGSPPTSRDYGFLDLVAKWLHHQQGPDSHWGSSSQPQPCSLKPWERELRNSSLWAMHGEALR